MLCVFFFFIHDGLHYDFLVKNVPVFIIQDRYHTWRNSDTVNPSGLIAADVMERGYFSDLLKYYFILISDFFVGVLTNTSSCCFTFCSTYFLKIYTFSVIIIVNCRHYIVSEKIYSYLCLDADTKQTNKQIKINRDLYLMHHYSYSSWNLSSQARIIKWKKKIPPCQIVSLH